MSFSQFLDYFSYFCQYLSNYQLNYDIFGSKRVKSYLTRTQEVKFDNIVSSQRSVKTSIGQGTILGPLLFIFYINDLTSVIHDLKINMNADDCILYTSGNNWNIMSQEMQPEIDKVKKWCISNGLKINESKSKVLLFASRQKLCKVNFSINLMLGNIALSYCNK